MKNKIIKYKNYLGIIIYNKKGVKVCMAKVDRKVENKIKNHNWYWGTRANGEKGYIRSGSDHKSLHILILGKKEGLEIDHINRNPTDNRKSNLRFVTHAENIRNAKIQSNNKSGTKGVHWSKENKRWIALIKVNTKPINLGSYIDKKDAVTVRKEAEKRYFSVRP